MIETVLVVWTFHTTQSVSTNTAATTWFLKIILIKKFDCTLIGWAWPCLAHPWIRHWVRQGQTGLYLFYYFRCFPQFLIVLYIHY